MNPFKPGDIVVLNSGSPPLTVIKIEDDKTTVLWIDKDGNQRMNRLPSVCFQLVASK